MNNQFTSDVEEFKRVTTLVAGMSWPEARRFLTYRSRQGYYARLLAEALGINQARLLGAVSFDVHKALTQAVPESPVPPTIIPDPIPAPLPAPTAPQPPVSSFGPLCDGCGGVGDSPVFLRWDKVARGEPVTVSLDIRGRPATLNWLTPEVMLKEWFEPWAVGTSIRFKFVTGVKGDIHVRFAKIDGPGRVLGMAYQPRVGNLMEAGGSLSGDIIIDNEERWSSRDEVNETGEHEVGHAIGMPHTNKPEDKMYKFGSRVRRPQAVNDRRGVTKRYPPNPNLDPDIPLAA